MFLKRHHAGSVLVASSVVAILAAQSQQPQTEKRPVTDSYHGVTVVDDYRWLENWDDPAVKAWSDGQNAHAREVLDALPAVSDIRKRVTELRGGESGYVRVAFRGGRIFALKRDALREQPRLVTLTTPGDVASERVVLDPLVLDPKGGHPSTGS